MPIYQEKTKFNIESKKQTPKILVEEFSGFALFVTKATPGSTGGIEKLLARGKVDKKKAPWYIRSGLPTTQLK